MYRISRTHPQSPVAKRAGAIAAALFAAAMTGCSADVSRFDLGSGIGSPDRTTTGSVPSPSEPLRRNSSIPIDDRDAPRGPGSAFDRAPSGGAHPPGPAPQRDAPVRMSGLPEPVGREPAQRALPPSQPRGSLPPAGSKGSIAAVPPPPMPAAGQTIEVQQGDTLYAISKRHHVSISELMTLNRLSTPAIKPGQKLSLPAGKRPVAQRTLAPAPQATVSSRQAPAVASPAAPTSAPADWNGTYTVAPGDSIYGLSRKFRVKAADLQATNGITDPTKVRPGTVLKVPGNAGGAPSPASEPLAAAPVPVAPILAPASGAVGRPTIINASQSASPAPMAGAPPVPAAAPAKQIAALGTHPTATDATEQPKSEPSIPEPPKTTTAGKFRWPVKGKVIASFGPRLDNTHNDGINISVPLGTEILAAENGVVAYAGNELKGYGNLVLIRHEGNWVSAYAHADQIMVKRGDKVKRGQAIAKAGSTGTVDQPQVHFELRQGSKPIDPLPHMERQ